MADVAARYPISTPTGEAIPLDVVRPVSALRKTFASGAATAAIALTSTIDVIIVYATQDMWVAFAASAPVAAVPADGTLTADLFFVPAGMHMTISPPIGKRSISLIGDTAAGIAYIQLLENWSALALSSQLTRA